jgi:putative copper export protein
MKRVFRILVGFIHDFAVGCWAATVLSIYWLDRSLVEHYELKSVISGLKKEFFYLGLIFVAIVLFTGIGRTFTYIESAYGEDAEKLRKRMLIIKHIILFTIFSIGTYWQYRTVFK